MGLDVSALSTYTKELQDELLFKLALGFETIDDISVKTDIKNTDKFTVLDRTTRFQTGRACDLSNSGSTPLTQVSLSVVALADRQIFCPTETAGIETTWLSTRMPGSTHDSLPFEEFFVQNKIRGINEALETAIWQGNTATGTLNNVFFNGYLQLLELTSCSASTKTGGNGSGNSSLSGFTGFSSSNAINVIDDMITNLTDAGKRRDDLRIYISYDNMNIYFKALRDANLFAFPPDGAGSGTFRLRVPNTSNVTMVAKAGLNDQNRIVLSYKENMWYGTDLGEREQDDIRIVRDETTEQVIMTSRWKSGVAIFDCSQVVVYNTTS